MHGRFGLQAAAKLLSGVSDPRLESAGLKHTKTFGALRDQSEVWITRLLRRCVTAGWVDFVGGDRPMLVLTREGVAVMRGEYPARLLLPAGVSKPETPSLRSPPSRGRAIPEPELDAEGQALFEALREHRLEVARALGAPPYVVASDRTLRDIARLRPDTPEALGQAHGIGPTKIRRFGKGLLAVVRARRG